MPSPSPKNPKLKKGGGSHFRGNTSGKRAGSAANPVLLLSSFAEGKKKTRGFSLHLVNRKKGAEQKKKKADRQNPCGYLSDEKGGENDQPCAYAKKKKKKGEKKRVLSDSEGWNLLKGRAALVFPGQRRRGKKLLLAGLDDRRRRVGRETDKPITSRISPTSGKRRTSQRGPQKASHRRIFCRGKKEDLEDVRVPGNGGGNGTQGGREVTRSKGGAAGKKRWARRGPGKKEKKKNVGKVI